MANEQKITSEPAAQQSLSGTEEWKKQREFFQKNGYLWIKNFFSAEQVRLFQTWAEELNASAQSILTLTNNTQNPKAIPLTLPGAVIVVPEASNAAQVCRTEDMSSCHPELYHFISGTLTTYISRLMGEPHVLFKDKLNFKWPGGGAFLPHQDYPAYEPFAPKEHVTAMICVDPATIENGCLQVAKNWHDLALEQAGDNKELAESGHVVLPYVVGGKDHGSIQPQIAKKIEWLQLETAPGDLVLINSYVPHYSEPNKSKHSRRAMFLTHNRLKEGDHRKAYYHAKRNDPDNPVFHFATPTKARTK